MMNICGVLYACTLFVGATNAMTVQVRPPAAGAACHSLFSLFLCMLSASALASNGKGTHQLILLVWQCAAVCTKATFRSRSPALSHASQP